jgi:aspartyl-tRNA(Asn)/glutamyl-tRNA(Gln) amidotransferase subunit C
MSIGRKEVLHVARLAELAVSEEDLPRLTEQLARIVGYVEQLNQVSASEEAPAFLAGPAQVALREDKVDPVPLQRTPAEIAPEFMHGFFSVPKLGAMEDS